MKPELVTPAAFERELDEIRSLAADLRAEYRWTYAYALGQTSGGLNGGTRPSGPESLDHADATGETAVDSGKGRARHDARATVALVREAVGKLRAAQTRIHKATTTATSPVHDPGPDVKLPKDELAALGDAKRRREGRGEGWGVG